MQKVDPPTSFTKLNENCGLPDIFTDYQIRHLGNPSGLPEILVKIDPCTITHTISFWRQQLSQFVRKFVSQNKAKNAGMREIRQNAGFPARFRDG